ncbi:ATP-binding protein [Jeotgalibacillus proteolyticus]|uniref:histidine kinase n=1 Tax=Jeotgalibacillus proteolyticus TaxID=2082395 RepID=A0A2S5G9Y1_9BACL|nr:ATP-binding protein [Jeotgalibacillus proteolyticus]PPA69723.1 PAS domain-containing sensor histidine kinase [Jeotgalibacillus proteolyticus]
MLLQSYTISQIRALIGLFLFLIIVEVIFLFAGSLGLLQGVFLTIAELLNIGLLVAAAIIIYIRYRKIKKFIQEKEDEELKMTALIQSMPDFVCFKDGEGRWIKTNDFGLELYGLTNDQYVNKTDIELGLINPFFKDAFDYCTISDEETWQKAITVRAEEAFFIPSGELKTFDVIKVPLFYEDGSRKALITIGRDISQQKLAEEQLVKQEKLAVAGELAAGIAHEIKNPLTSLKGFVQLMKEETGVSQEKMDVMTSEMNRIQSIVEELLVLSKPQTRLKESLSLHSAIEYVVKLLKHQALENGVTLHFEEINEGPDDVLGDRNQLIQVFINLVKNGIESMQDGGELHLQTIRHKEWICVCVKDRGHGISDEGLTKLGQPFFTTKSKGVGLGITICQKIIHEHNGRIVFKNNEHAGTTVLVKLPLYNEN